MVPKVMALPIFILVVIFAVMVIFAVVNKWGWKSLFILPVLFIVILVAPLFLSMQRRVRVVESDVYLEPDAMTTMPAIWADGIEGQFEADIYPSRERAAQALAQQAAPLLSTVTPNQSFPSSIEVYGSRNIPIQLLNVFADTLEELTGVSNMLVQSSSPNFLKRDPNGVVIALIRADWDTSSRSYNPYLTRNHSTQDEVVLQGGSGTLRIHIEGTDGQPVISRSVEVAEKPWVQNLNLLLNENPNAHLAVTRSSQTCTDQLEARQQAMNSALSVVQGAIAQGTSSHSTHRSAINAISEQDLTQYDLILDQFSQSFNSATSRIWRHAILLDLGSHKLTSLFQNKLNRTITERVSQRKTWAKQFGSLAGLALVVLILYVFLNAATKGYYTWSLRIASIILIGIFVVAVLNFV